jgi:hypothetical protein
MARVRNNAVTESLRGKVGNIVFRSRNGKTHAYIINNPAKPESDKQKKNQQKFGMAVQYAKDAIADSEKKQLYTKIAKKLNKESAYSAALSDYMNDLVYAKIFSGS